MITYTVHSWDQHGEEVAFDVTAKEPAGDHVRAVVTLALGDDRLVPEHADVERWLPAGWLAFFSAHSEDPSCEVEDGLLDALCAVVSVDDLEREGSCGGCAGSGLGMHDGSWCFSCRGSGVRRSGGRDDDE